MNHLGDTNKMVSETPRTDDAEYLSYDSNPPESLEMVDVDFARKLERELNAANVEIEEKRKDVVYLATEKAKLEERIKRLEEAGNALLWYFCPKNTGDISFLQSEAIKQWNKAKEAKL